MLGQCIKLSQFDIELPLPEFVGRTFRQRFAVRIDHRSASAPSFLTPVDRDTAVDEPSSNGAFHLIDPLVKRFSILDERAEFAVRF